MAGTTPEHHSPLRWKLLSPSQGHLPFPERHALGVGGRVLRGLGVAPLLCLRAAGLVRFLPPFPPVGDPIPRVRLVALLTPAQRLGRSLALGLWLSSKGVSPLEKPKTHRKGRP